MNAPWPTDEARRSIPQSAAGCDIISVPIIHQAATYATYVSCDPLHKDFVLGLYADLGWQVENITDDDYRNVQARRVRMLLLEAWSAAEGSGDSDLEDKVRNLYYAVEGRN